MRAIRARSADRNNLFQIALLISAVSDQDYEYILSVLASFTTTDECHCQVRNHMEFCEGTPANIYSGGVEMFVIVVCDTIVHYSSTSPLVTTAVHCSGRYHSLNETFFAIAPK
jgi:hypothetical protein